MRLPGPSVPRGEPTPYLAPEFLPEQAQDLTHGAALLERAKRALDSQAAEHSRSCEGDCYAVGVILWELWFVTPPFNGVVDRKVVKFLRKGRRLPMDVPGAPEPPPALANLVESLWIHEPEKRITAEQALNCFKAVVAPALLEEQPLEKTTPVARPSPRTPKTMQAVKASGLGSEVKGTSI